MKHFAGFSCVTSMWDCSLPVIILCWCSFYAHENECRCLLEIMQLPFRAVGAHDSPVDRQANRTNCLRCVQWKKTDAKQIPFSVKCERCRYTRKMKEIVRCRMLYWRKFMLIILLFLCGLRQEDDVRTPTKNCFCFSRTPVFDSQVLRESVLFHFTSIRTTYSQPLSFLSIILPSPLILPNRKWLLKMNFCFLRLVDPVE